MRKGILWAACMILALGTVGCGSKKADSAKNDSGNEQAEDAAADGDYSDVEFRVAWWGGDQRNTQTVEMIENFEKQYPNLKIDVEYGAYGDYFTKLTTQATAGNLPDVYLMDYSKIVEFAEAGQLEVLDEYIASGAIDLSDVDDSMVAGGKVDDKMYAITTGVNAQVMMYDPAMLEEAGLTLSQAPTWSELLGVIEGVYEKTGYQVHMNPHVRSFEIYLRSLGKQMYTEDGSGFAFTAEDLTSYLEKYYDLYESGMAISTADFTGEGISLKDGTNIWLTLLGDCYSNMLITKGEEAGKKLAICCEPTPENSTVNGTYVKPQMLWGISSTSKNKDLAADFVNYCVNETSVYDICGTEKGIPISNEMRLYVEENAGEVDKTVAEFITFLSEGVATPISEPASSGASEAENFIFELNEQIMYKALEKEDIQDAAAMAIEEGNAVLAKNAKGA